MRAYRYISSKIHTAVCITNKYYRSIFTPRQHVCVSTNMHSNSSMSFKPGYLMLVSVCPVRRCCLLWSRSVARNVAHTPRPTYSCSAHLLDLVVISSMLLLLRFSFYTGTSGLDSARQLPPWMPAWVTSTSTPRCSASSCPTKTRLTSTSAA